MAHLKVSFGKLVDIPGTEDYRGYLSKEMVQMTGIVVGNCGDKFFVRTEDGKFHAVRMESVKSSEWVEKP